MSNYIKLINNLEILKLERIKQNSDKYLELINNNEKDLVDVLYELTNLEIELMNEKAIYRCVRSARFPFIKHLKILIFSFQQTINKEQLLDFKNLRFVTNKKILFL